MNDEDENLDFDEVDDGTAQEENEKRKEIVSWVITCVVALIVGITVYFITDALINGKNKKVVELKDMPMSLNDEMVVYLYDNISYSVNGIRNNIYFRNDVNLSDFSNKDKFFFAFRYIPSSDFVPIYEEIEEPKNNKKPNDKVIEDGDVPIEDDDFLSDEEEELEEPKLKIKEFSVSNDVIAQAMHNYFGDETTYSTTGEIPIGVNFSIKGNNAGLLRYDSTSDSFLIVFDRKFNKNQDIPIKPSYGQLISAVRLKDGDIILKEKVVFTKYTVKEGATLEENIYNYSICGDLNCTNVLDTKTGVKHEDFYNNPIEVSNYEDSALNITYTFKKDDVDEYHFYSSKLG